MNEAVGYQFGAFTVHETRRELNRDGAPLEIGSRALDVLLALLRRHAGVATKSDIMTEVWPGVIVEENNLTTQIATVRRVLGEGVDGQRFILTVPGRGYRFVAPVRLVGDGAAPAPAVQAPIAPIADAPRELHNLPLETSSFVGRTRELAELRDRVANRALVTLVGSGGVGKTRVALTLAGRLLGHFPDGVTLLELAPLANPSLVAEALCRVLGMANDSTRAPLDVAISLLRQKRMLLVLDNCEHVLSGAAELAAAAARACPDLRILATSREALGVPGEAAYPLPCLPLPAATARITAAEALQSDAVRLFVERAADALGEYTLTDEDAGAVATICRRLDGVPLATELAAARLRVLKPAEIAARLENVFRLLTGGSRTALPRQQTLRATLDWSFSLLSAEEQILLRRLAVFVDGCTLEGAMAVATCAVIEADAVFDLLAALVSKSLVVADTCGRQTRYRLLETTRQYAAEKLAEAGESALHARMAGHMLEVFTRAETLWPISPTQTWLREFAPEAENLRAAIDGSFANGENVLGIALVAVCGSITDELSRQADLRRWTASALPHLAQAGRPEDAARVLYLHSAQQKRVGTRQVTPERQQATDWFRQQGDALWLSRALRQTAVARATSGAPNNEIIAMLDEAATLLRPRGATKDLATALAHAGGVQFLYANHAASRSLTEEALAMREKLGDRSGVLASMVNLAELLFIDGDPAAAIAYARKAEAEARRCNALTTLALILGNLAGYQLAQDDTEGALRAGREALRLARDIGQDYLAVMCQEHLALALALDGQFLPAARLLGQVDARYAESGQRRERLEAEGHNRLLRLLREALPSAALRAALAEGAAWSADAADGAAHTQ